MIYDIATTLPLVKAQVGLSSGVRDAYLTEIIKSVETQFKNTNGLTLDPENSQHLMLVVDYAAWRYQHKDSADAMPQHLRYRLRELQFQSSISGA